MTLLESLGHQRFISPWTKLLRQPAYSSGHEKEAFAVANAQLDLFPEDWPIVVPSGSCGGMMKLHWPTLFAGSEYEARANELAGRVVEFTHFLLNIGYQPEDKGEPIKVAVHTSCTARREMNVHLSGWKLIDSLKKPWSRVVHDHESRMPAALAARSR